jgi:hypothetical protein
LILINLTINSVAYLGEIITDPLTKKTVPGHHLQGGLQQHLREATKRASSHFLSRLEKVVAD